MSNTVDVYNSVNKSKELFSFYLYDIVKKIHNNLHSEETRPLATMNNSERRYSRKRTGTASRQTRLAGEF